MTPEPVIMDAEVEAFHERFSKHGFDARSALAAFLKARVPEERTSARAPDIVSKVARNEGFNACRDAVLRGKG